MSERRRSLNGEAVGTPRDKETMQTFAGARRLLKKHLVHTREVPNGRDFLFLGPNVELHDALRLVIDVEQKNRRFIHFDFARVDEYFLLRVLGTEADQVHITGYFE
jgi:hypothetical protein